MLNWIFRTYKSVFSPVFVFFGAQCRFQPTCSEYAHDAIETHGWFLGLILGFFRLCRCHPFGGRGFDPVPKELKLHKFFSRLDRNFDSSQR